MTLLVDRKFAYKRFAHTELEAFNLSCLVIPFTFAADFLFFENGFEELGHIAFYFRIGACTFGTLGLLSYSYCHEVLVNL